MSMDLAHGFTFGSVSVEPLSGYVQVSDCEPRHLPPKAMEVLVCLASNAPETVTREQLLDEIWATKYVSDEVVTHAITELRQALGDDWCHPKFIETIPKRGYRLLKPVQTRRSQIDDTGVQAGPRVSPSLATGAIRRYLVFAIPIVAGTVVGLLAVLDPRPEAGGRLPIGTGHDTSPVSTAATEIQQPEVDTSGELFLRAKSMASLVTSESTQEAEELLEQAVTADSRDALAWDLLGRVYLRQATLFHDRTVDDAAELARQAIQRSLAIDPLYGPAHADLALVNLAFDFDFQEAYRHLRHAQDLTPSDPHVLRVAARLEMTHNHLDHAIDLLERSVTLDPGSCLAYAALGQAYFFADRLEDAEKSLETSLLLNPDAVRTRYLLGLVLLSKNAPRGALIAMEEEPDSRYSLIGQSMAQYTLGDDTASDAALASAREALPTARPYQVARAYAFRGQHEEAIEWLERAYRRRDGDVTYLLVDPMLAGLRTTEHWNAVVEKLGLSHRI